jgi:hypothetical protein
MTHMRKMFLLAAAMAALVAFAAPAAAQADGPQWYAEDTDEPLSEPRHIALSGGIIGYSGHSFSWMCHVEASGYIWNEEGQGSGEIDQVMTESCGGGGCKLTVTNNASAESPWSVGLASGGSSGIQLNLGDIAMENTISNPETCGYYSHQYQGTLTGSVVHDDEQQTSKVIYDNAFFGSGPVRIVSGDLDLVDLSGEPGLVGVYAK